MSDKNSDVKVAIVGGGLVGSLNACFFARRGFQVELYEYRPDIRKTEHVRGRSINLALSVRGLSALRAVGLEERVLEHGIPMYGRMIHDRNGSRHRIPYGRRNQCIYSVGRRYLNEIILNEAGSNPNVTFHHECKLVHADLKKGLMKFTEHSTVHAWNDGGGDISVSVTADLVVGCDGAFSTVRRQMLKEPQFDFSQKYIEHGYLELCMPPNEYGEFAMESNYLHIWPRGDHMMIALPNQDKSYTVTLFMPFEKFASLETDSDVVKFFAEMFPDALELIGRSQLVVDFFSLKPSSLLTIKCNPYHVSDRAVIMGDAAHAMVPFYGQGMNAGFEDCLIFDQLMSEYDCDFGIVLKAFSSQRNTDAEAICDLALYNYVEMRHLVTTKSFLIRKHVDSFLNLCLPNTWIPLYTMVTFSRTSYRTCVARRKWQNKVLLRSSVALLLAAIGLGVYYCSASLQLFADG